MQESGPPCGERAADLMSSEHPPVYDGATVPAEVLEAQRDGRWHGRYPVESIEHHHAPESSTTMGERRIEDEQRQASEQVIAQQQLPRIEPIR